MEIIQTGSGRVARPLRRVALLVLPLLLATWAQWALSTERLALDGAVLFTLAIALFLLFTLPGQRLASRFAADAACDREAPLNWSLVRTPLAVAAACAVLTWTLSEGNRFRLETLVLWALAVGFYLVALWDRAPTALSDPISRFPRLSRESVAIPWSAVGLLLVVAVAAFFRFHQIGSVPAEMTSDHAEKLLDVRDVMNGEHRIFFPRNTGREPLQFYMAVPFVWLVGLNHLALKLVSATVSLATVPVVFLIGREIAGARFGLLAAALLAISGWDVTIGRVGLRFPFYPFFTALAFYFLLRAMKSGRRNDYLMCGITTGVGLYGYSPFRVILVIIAASLLLKALFDLRSGFRAILPTIEGGAMLLGAISVVLIPLARFVSEAPETFWHRAATRLSAGDTLSSAGVMQVLLGNLSDALLMFNWKGDVVWVNTVPHAPALDYVTGGLFLLGVAWAIHAMAVWRERVPAYLLLALVVSMLPSILSVAFPNENPSVVRSGGAGVFVALLAAVPLYLTARGFGEIWPTWRGGLIAATAIVLMLLMAGRASYDRYFGEYDSQYRQSAINTTEISRVIIGFSSSVGSTENVYIKSWPHWVDARNVAFTIGQPDWDNVLMTDEELVSHTPPSGNRLYILNKDDAEGARLLQRRFPWGEIHRQPSEVPGREFLVFFAAESP